MYVKCHEQFEIGAILNKIYYNQIKLPEYAPYNTTLTPARRHRHPPEVVIQGGGGVGGGGEYLVQGVAFVAVKLQQVVAHVVCLEVTVAPVFRPGQVGRDRRLRVHLVNLERCVVGGQGLSYALCWHTAVPETNEGSTCLLLEMFAILNLNGGQNLMHFTFM